MVLRVQVPDYLINGDVDEGYGPVADAFRRNFGRGEEIGSALAVYRGGRKVVDLWGGYRDGVSKQRWTRDTIVPMFSTTKGMSALAVAVAVSQGLLDFDAPVADYWPEFGAAGKESVTVRQLLNHEAGLPVIDPVTLSDVADHERLATILARQRPAWAPGTAHGYHSNTLGWYESELIRRVDPQRRTLGQYFAANIAQPLELDFYIGLPDGVEKDRIARLHGFTPFESLLHLRVMPWQFVVRVLNPNTLTARAFSNPRELVGPESFNRSEIQRLEIPATNGIGTARSVAKAYATTVSDRGTIGLSETTYEELLRPAAPPSRDRVIQVDTAFSLGFVKPVPRHFVFGSSEKAFGHAGLGGSFAFADPDTEVGFAYAMNRLGFRMNDDPRELALREALFHDVLGERRQAVSK